MGARFAKWRAVIHVADTLPSHACIDANAHALALRGILPGAGHRSHRRARARSRAISGVSTPYLPITSRRVRASEFRYWMKKVFTPDSLVAAA
jgi:hypothetical protein